ncbi:Hsp20/alpha crystallin family protein [Kutzneria kofuensis]|jgi:HSP20 family molecular chaperone IbpA|uniref:HSP20 family molecular chaperone IbpA n=1 Tax=Kutzneria kofuensis TaxID=103725 RepID=A0A7W9KQF4_9PSEU|nr:Hsp20/alpha crystallin family protein [Kutzneria kofuensis]MBB5896725.1 HSP20 family molecular chaperone IbpA [Kutzneria kofuensis]
MAKPVRRQHGLLPDLIDWAESFPSVFGLRPAPGMRVEDFVEDGMYVVRAELPGIDPAKDVTITVHDRLLTISAERAEETTEKNHSEFRYGSFSRTVSLPAEAREEEIKAGYADGILTVRVPVDETATPHRKIEIETGDKG